MKVEFIILLLVGSSGSFRKKIGTPTSDYGTSRNKPKFTLSLSKKKETAICFLLREKED